MGVIGDLLGDVLDGLTQAPPTAADTPRRQPPTPVGWVRDRITSPQGMLALARAGLADDVDTVLEVAAVLCRKGRSSTKSLVQYYGWDTVLVAKIRHTLPLLGLEGLGRSWAPDPTPGKVARIPVWNGRLRWLTTVSIQLLTPAGKSAINRSKSSRPLVMRVARADAAVADGRTGRGVRTAHETVARQLGVTRDAVRHARYVLEALGMSVTVIEGRYLTADERAAAHASHGGWQRRVASTRMLTIPRHLPRSGSVSTSPTVSFKSPRRAGAPKRRTPRKPLPPIPLEWQRLAAQVVHVLPHMGQRHIGNLARAIQRLPIDPSQWTGHALVRLVEISNRSRGLSQPQHRGTGIGLFLHQVKGALTQ